MNDDDWSETVTLTFTNSNGDLHLNEKTQEALTIMDFEYLFESFLQGSGYNYVTGVTIHTGDEGA